VGVEQPSQQAAKTASMPVRRVRVAGPVGERMVPPVRCDPADDVALEAHRPGDRQHEPKRRHRSETPMREAAVKASRDAEPGENVQAGHQEHVGQPDPVAPCQPDSRDQSGDRDAGDCPGDRHLHRTADGTRGQASIRERRDAVVVLDRPFWQCLLLGPGPLVQTTRSCT
jgi:hypothetical protein